MKKTLLKNTLLLATASLLLAACGSSEEVEEVVNEPTSELVEETVEQEDVQEETDYVKITEDWDVASDEEHTQFIEAFEAYKDINNTALTITESITYDELAVDDFMLEQEEFSRNYVLEDGQYTQTQSTTTIKTQDNIQDSLNEVQILGEHMNIVHQILDTESGNFYGDLEQLIESQKIYINKDEETLADSSKVLFKEGFEDRIEKLAADYEGKYAITEFGTETNLTEGYTVGITSLLEYWENNNDLDIKSDGDTIVLELDTTEMTEHQEIFNEQVAQGAYSPFYQAGGVSSMLVEVDKDTSDITVSQVILDIGEETPSDVYITTTHHIEPLAEDETLALPEEDAIAGNMDDVAVAIEEQFGYYDESSIQVRTSFLTIQKESDDEDSVDMIMAQTMPYIAMMVVAEEGLDQDTVEGYAAEFIEDEALLDKVIAALEEAVQEQIEAKEAGSTEEELPNPEDVEIQEPEKPESKVDEEVSEE